MSRTTRVALERIAVAVERLTDSVETKPPEAVIHPSNLEESR